MADKRIWLKGSFHMPLSYSIRMPPSSPFAGRALPAPGPATVQLALIRVGVELFGLSATRRNLFSSILTCEPRVQPPLRLGITDQLSTVLKGNREAGVESTAGYREVCHCEGPITVFVNVPQCRSDQFRELLMGIGYWGQGDGFACCTSVEEAVPTLGNIAVPFESAISSQRVHRYFSSYVTELRSTDLDWHELVSASSSFQVSPLRFRLYVWPLILCEHRGSGRLLQFYALV